MTKMEGIIYGLGKLIGHDECDVNYKTVRLGEILGEKYDKYVIGWSNGDRMICLIDTSRKEADSPRGRYVIEIYRFLPVDYLVNLILTALAADLRSQKK